jgi:hypothetical protein
VPLDQEGADAAPGEHDGRGEAGEAATYDEDGDVDMAHGCSPIRIYDYVYPKSDIRASRD